MEYLVLSGNGQSRKEYSGTPDEVLRMVYADFGYSALLTELPWKRVERAEGYDAVLLCGVSNPSTGFIRRIVSNIAEGHPDCYEEDILAECTDKGLLLVNTGIDRLDFISFIPYYTGFKREYYRFAFSPVVIPSSQNVDCSDRRGMTALITAARAGALSVMEGLISKGADVNKKSRHGITALMYASGYSHDIRCVELLLSSGARIDARDRNNWTPLQYAAGYNPDPAFMSLLLKQGARTDLITTNGYDLLMNACWSNGNKAVIELILDLGFDANCGKGERNPLTAALSGNRNPEIIKLLLERGADPFYRFKDKTTVLSFAAGHNTEPEIIRLLLDAGVSVNARSKGGWTALMHASAYNPSIKVLRLLLEKGADLSAADLHGKSALYCALYSPNEREICEFLAANGALRFEEDPYVLVNTASHAYELEDYVEREGIAFSKFIRMKGLLAMAAQDNIHAEVIEVLLERGADINSKDRAGTSTALHGAVSSNKNPEIACLLVERGADLESRDLDGSTPLSYAVKARRPEMVRLLTEHGADASAMNNYGYSMLSQAVLSPSSSLEIVRLLLDAGAGVDETSDGVTPLMDAAEALFSDEIIKELLSRGADVNKLDRAGRSALMHCAMYGKQASTVELLLRSGADPTLRDYFGETAFELARARRDGKDLVKAFTDCSVNGLPPDETALRLGSLSADGMRLLRGYSIDYEYCEKDGLERIKALRDGKVIGETAHVRTSRFLKAIVAEVLSDDGVEALCCCFLPDGPLVPVRFVMPAVRPSYLWGDIIYFQGTGYLVEGHSGIYEDMEEAWRAFHGDGSHENEESVIEPGDGRTGRLFGKLEGFHKLGAFCVVDVLIPEEGCLPFVVPSSYLDGNTDLLHRLENGLTCYVSGDFYISGDAAYGQYREGAVIDEENLMALLAYSMDRAEISRIKPYLAPDCCYRSENKELHTAAEVLSHLAFSSRFQREQMRWHYEGVTAHRDGRTYLRGKEGSTVTDINGDKVMLVFFINEREGQIQGIQFEYDSIASNWHRNDAARFEAAELSCNLFIERYHDWIRDRVPVDRYLAIPLFLGNQERDYTGGLSSVREKARHDFDCDFILAKRPWKRVSARDGYDAVFFEGGKSAQAIIRLFEAAGLDGGFFVTRVGDDVLAIDLSGNRRSFADYFTGPFTKKYFQLEFEVLTPYNPS